MLKIRSGIGYHAHKVEKTGNPKHLLIHALINSLLAAAGEQNNEKGSNIVKSAAGLKKTIQILDEKNFEIINIDAVIIGVISKNHHRTNEIKTGIRSILGMTAEDINVKNVKAQTREAKKIAGIEGRAGRGEPMECYCVSMIRSLA